VVLLYLLNLEDYLGGWRETIDYGYLRKMKPIIKYSKDRSIRLYMSIFYIWTIGDVVYKGAMQR
jgi:hypothetical protein